MMLSALLAMLPWQGVPPPPAAVPPPLEQSSADCERPTYASDHLVCGNADLRRLDEELVTLLSAGPEPSGPWIEPQTEWFRRSRTCAFSARHAACLDAAYQERIGLLQAASRPPTADLACRPASLKAALQPEGLLIVDGANLAGIAARAADGWQPFLKLRAGKRENRVHDRQGRLVARCSKPS
jgi:uncharacterized protein